MIGDLDRTIGRLLHDRAPAGSELAAAEVSFEPPDGRWRQALTAALTVNCYLYAVGENMQLRTAEPVAWQPAGGGPALRRDPPLRLDCTYAITAWSRAEEGTLDEHRLLGQVLRVLLRHRTLPRDVLAPGLADQQPPYPTGIAGRDGAAGRPEFWAALEQRPRPALIYVVTLAVFAADLPAPAAGDVEHVVVAGGPLDRPVGHGLSGQEVAR